MDEARASETPEDAGRRLRPNSAEWRWLLVLTAVGLALRLALIFGLRTYVIPPKDDHYLFAHEYGRIARSLAVGEGYACTFEIGKGGPTVNGAPFFAFSLSLLFRVFGVYSQAAAAALLVTNSVASVATVVLVFVLGKRLFGAGPGWLAAVVLCFDPTPVWYSVNCTWETALSLFALTLLPLLFVWFADRPGARRGAVLGVAAAGLAHVNAGALTVSAVLGVWLLVRSRGLRVSVLRGVSVAALVGAATIAPWSVRNSLLLGRPVILRGAGDMVFYAGNHPGATGDVVEDEKAAYVTHNRAEREKYYRMGEAAYFSHCRERALAFIREQPGVYARLVLKRGVIFWLGDLWTTRDWQGGVRTPFSLVGLKKMVHFVPVPFAIAGLVVALRRRCVVWPLVGQAAAFSIPYMLTFCALSRYRVPIHASLVLLSCVALSAAFAGVRGRWLEWRREVRRSS